MKILFTAEADNEVLKLLDKEYELILDGWNQGKSILGEEELIEKLQGIDIFATSYDKVTKKVIESCPSLKLIACTRSTPVNIDIESAKENGIEVINTPGRNSDVTAEFAVGMLLDITRNITAANQKIKNFDVIMDDSPLEEKKDVTWGMVKGIRPYHAFKGVQIKNKNMGILGYGSIGKRVAKIMEGFGTRILVFDPYINRMDIESPSVKVVDWDTLLKEADFISCHTKITSDTKGIFNKEAFLKMKKTAFLINNSRGAIINEHDLHWALKNGEIAGAALDVFEYEPLYKEHIFIREPLDNLLLTPHISGSSDDAITNGTIMLIDELNRYRKGKDLLFRCKK